MDIKEYISSGILENYVLGSVSQQEKQEVECMSHIYPEIKAELEQLQTTLENVAFKLQKDTPAHLKSKILNAIKNEKQEALGEKVVRKVVDINSSNNSNLWKYMAAASIVVTIGLAYLFYNSSSQLKSVKSQLSDMSVEMNESKNNFESELEVLSQKVERKKELLAFLQHSATKKIVLKGTDLQPTSTCIVYFNENTSKVFLDASPQMDKLPQDKQYQLWAIVDGKPVDMGTLTHDEPCDDLCPMPDVSDAQAFAITIEKVGGSATPSLDRLVVIGNV